MLILLKAEIKKILRNLIFKHEFNGIFFICIRNFTKLHELPSTGIADIFEIHPLLLSVNIPEISDIKWS
jgi:hypothetical protein